MTVDKHCHLSDISHCYMHLLPLNFLLKKVGESGHDFHECQTSEFKKNPKFNSVKY